MSGTHNLNNALAAVAAARHAGVPPKAAVEALSGFRNAKRRMELIGELGGVRVFDDFAHHPTAIETTLKGLGAQVPESRIIAILEPRSNTMRMGVHGERLPASLKTADRVLIFSPPDLEWNAREEFVLLGEKLVVCEAVEEIVQRVVDTVQAGDQVLIMSNGGFGGIHQRLLDALENRYQP